MADVSAWSTTASSNNSVSPDGFPENMAPSGVNDSAREVMAAVARWYSAARTVATLSALQALAAPSEAAILGMQGRIAAGDGGEGQFRWDASNLSTEVAVDEVTSGQGDGGIYVAPSSDRTGASGAWVRITTPGEMFPVQWWGAAVDGSTDDTTAVVSAIESVATNQGGGTVTISGGVCLCNTTSNAASSGLARIIPLIYDDTYLHIAEGATLKTTANARLITVGGTPDLGDVNDLTVYDLSGSYTSGDQALTLATASEASNFSAGDWLYIRTGQLDTDGIDNPDAEYVRVQSVSSGTITLEWPLEKDYAQENYPTGHSSAGSPAPYGVTNATSVVRERLGVFGRGTIENISHDVPLIHGNQLMQFYLGGGLTLNTAGVGLSMGATDSLFEDYVMYGRLTSDKMRCVVIDHGNTRTTFRNIRGFSRGIAQCQIEAAATCRVENVMLFSSNEDAINETPVNCRSRAKNVRIDGLEIVGGPASGSAFLWQGDSDFGECEGLFLDGLRVRGDGSRRVSLNGDDAFLGIVETDELVVDNDKVAAGEIDLGRFRLELPVASFSAVAGTPDLEPQASRYAGWTFLQGADESVSAQFRAPRGSKRIAVLLSWFNRDAAGSGNVRWRASLRGIAAGEDVAVGGTAAASTVAATANTNLTQTVLAISSDVLADGDLVTLAIEREGTNAADTLTDDVALIGVSVWRSD